jgi:Flp pilus assembly protein TadG
MVARRRQRGQAIVLIALMMAVLVGFVALAIDSARAFDSRRIMQDATDSAALAAAEYYQNHPGGWTAAESLAADYFAEDNRLYTSHSCTPGSVAPGAGAPGVPLTMSCSFGSSGYQLTIAAEDDGPGGQTFTLTGSRSLDLALMQVLGQSPTITVEATSAATASDQARTPALAGLSSSGCFGATGTAPVNVTSFTNPVTIVGDVVADGTFSIGINSFPRIAGNVLTRCAAPTNESTNLTYYCWPAGTAPPCGGGSVPGRRLSTGYRFVDPGYSAPPAPAGTVGFDSSKVVVSPGIYSGNPTFGSSSATCYFLAPGAYEWQAGLTVARGIVSNELKPPDEPDLTDATDKTVSAHQFWNDNGATCAGSFALSSGSSAGKGIADGTWSVVVTSTRTETYNSATFFRESAPSACRQTDIAGPDKTLAVTVNNVPGATGYNVYASPPGAGGCGGPFGLVAAGSIANSTIEVQGTLGTSSGSWNSDTLGGWAPDVNATPDTAKAYAPDPERSPWNGSTLANRSPARGSSGTSGDRANENHCATAGGVSAPCPAAVTPGAVVMSYTNNLCFNVQNNLLGTGGDAFLFSGYQYDWLLNYEPPTSSCFNTWKGIVNSAAMGLTYLPGATITIVSAAGFSDYTGGVVANAILIQAASNLLIDFNKDYAPYPGGTALTG